MRKVLYICDICGKEITLAAQKTLRSAYLLVLVEDFEAAEDLGVQGEISRDTLICDKCLKLLLSNAGEVRPVPEGEVKHEIVVPEKVTGGEPVVQEAPEKRKGGPRPLDDEKRQTILFSYMDGETVGSIAKVAGYSSTVVSKILSSSGFTMPVKASAETLDARRIDVGKVLALKKAGNLPDREIAVEAHIPEWSVGSIWERYRKKEAAK